MNLLSVAGKIYTGILMNRVHRVIEGLTNNEQRASGQEGEL